MIAVPQILLKRRPQGYVNEDDLDSFKKAIINVDINIIIARLHIITIMKLINVDIIFAT